MSRHVVWWTIFAVLAFSTLSTAIVVYLRRKDPWFRIRRPEVLLLLSLSIILGTLSLTLTQVIEGYPCSLYPIHDLLITNVGAAVYILIAFDLWFRLEWTRERQLLFLNREYPSRWFSNHAYLSKPPFQALCFLIAFLPQFGNVVKAIREGMDEDPSNCANLGLFYNTLYYGYIVCEGILLLALAWGLRMKLDPFGIRNDLRNAGIVLAICTVGWIIPRAGNNFGSDFHYNDLFLCLGTSLPFIVYVFSGIFSGFKNAKALQYDINGVAFEPMRNFLSVLNSKEGYEAFRQHLECEFSAENLLFYKDVLVLHGLEESEQKRVKAREIYELYIMDGAPLLVNISFRSSSVVKAKMVEVDYLDDDQVLQIFDKALQDVVALMYKDSFFRFKMTPQYESLIERIKESDVNMSLQSKSFFGDLGMVAIVSADADNDS